MVPILLCLGAWGWSRSHWTRIGYCHHQRFVGCASRWETVGVWWGTEMGQPEGWVCSTVSQDSPHLWSFLGFRYLHERDTTHTSTRLIAPWWFLIVVFSAILYVVWRKTQPRGTGRAFPVELTAPQSEPTDATS